MMPRGDNESYQPQPLPLSQEEYSRSELVRSLHRVEGVIRELKNEVVSRGVYEVEQRQNVAKLAELESDMEKERMASLARHNSLIASLRWAIGTALTSLLGVAGLVVAIIGKGG